ncbi:DUF3343 domain-containing protein [Alkaliphilus sp. MSJ-5]|uniref:DUF3343 domain-containing protein n=1 Tax=Alkaliphilus flagellatus TaxID=2841507 RepID=A0ABS6G6T4_9FIRM|nr:DUF3343 domain-containing protein [Alkaliphilus flagellatus]MBU5678200.1 DUF3343 domain-containing protein [Alkaliphilus flagellatus]
MIDQQFYVVVFESTHYAIAAEKLFKDKNYKFDVIPTPREITHSCGLSIRFTVDALVEMKREMEDAHIAIKGIYEIQKIDNEKIIKQIS